jgi:molecular chaperone DnaJ
MSDPYRVLGVSPTASDDEIKSAYRTLAKKYHPDNYANSPLADLASEKMKEVNEAYDQIVNERKNRASGGTYARQGQSYSGSAEYLDVRNLIVAGRLADAEQILDGVPPESRSAEWYFLKGTVLYKRGWLNEAYEDLTRACQMDPSNDEYRAALNQLGNQRSGMYGGYNPNVPMNTGNCTGCDICTSLCVAQTCCDCLGGMGPWC